MPLSLITRQGRVIRKSTTTRALTDHTKTSPAARLEGGTGPDGAFLLAVTYANGDVGLASFESRSALLEFIRTRRVFKGARR